MVIKNNLYNGEVELSFDSFKHQYTISGKKIPSVTTINSIIAKPALINWAANMAADSIGASLTPGVAYDELQLSAIIEAGRKAHWQKKKDAGDIGTFVHNWIESYIKGENPGMPVNEGLKKSIDQFLAWVTEHKVEFLVSEQIVYSKIHNYCGKLDFICKIDGKLYLGDLKTSSGIWAEYLLQTAAYRAAREEEFPQETYAGQLILRIGKDGSFEFAVFDSEEHYLVMLEGFYGALKLHRNMEALKLWEK